MIKDHRFEIKPEDKLPTEFKKKWVEALRSDNYLQGNEVLCNPTTYVEVTDSYVPTYCCLGVACAMQGIPNSTLNGWGFIDELDNDLVTAHEIPEQLIKDNMKSQVIDFLSSENDEGADFHEIADWIEENL